MSLMRAECLPDSPSQRTSSSKGTRSSRLRSSAIASTLFGRCRFRGKTAKRAIHKHSENRTEVVFLARHIYRQLVLVGSDFDDVLADAHEHAHEHALAAVPSVNFNVREVGVVTYARGLST